MDSLDAFFVKTGINPIFAGWVVAALILAWLQSKGYLK